ncbi:baseplate J/gp47 family protein [Nostoc sp. UIC 10607]|uniref:baseplate J/gp47 family protein n=1 Tax=Nostoc sp. UIC 10607 TaxID=3045935 RepID=UPI0039A27D39
MARGRIEPPNLDDRTWRDIVEQAKALIPVYAPEWTDHNPSDLGIALIELFAWIVEGMIYRLNRVPEKNYIEFLNLLGITRDPVIPATTVLTFRTANSTPVIVPAGSQYSTLPTANEDGIVFETDRELTVLPINLTNVLLIQQNKYKNITSNIVDQPLSGITITIPTGEQIVVTLGFDAQSTEQLNLICRFSQAIKTGLSGVRASWIYPNNETDLPSSWSKNPSIVQNETNGLQRNGIVSLKLETDWQSQNPEDWTGITADGKAINQKHYWLGLKVENSSDQTLTLGFEYILFNSVPATNALTVTQIETYISNGKPFQTFELKNAPLYKQTGLKNPYAHLEVQVKESQLGGGFEPARRWTQVEDFPEGDIPCYQVNPVSGTIYFGNRPKGSQVGNGRIPPDSSEIVVLKYRYLPAIGSKGNVTADTIKVPRTLISGIASFTNPGAATGGRDEEDIEETKRRASDFLRNRNRAITVEDYEYLAREPSTKVKKVRCLPPRQIADGDLIPPGADLKVGDPWMYGGLNRSLGNINVIIIPDATLENSYPMPSDELLQEVSDYLDDRRPITTSLGVIGPRYLPIRVFVSVTVWQSAIDLKLTSTEQVKDEIFNKISKFLHPLWGNVDGTGWEIGQEIVIPGLLEFIRLNSDIGFISDLKLQAAIPLYQPLALGRPINASTPGIWVQLADYEMICNGSNKGDITITTLAR